MFKRLTRAFPAVALVAAVLVLILVPVVQAQDYSFNVPETKVDLFLNGDGTAQIVYDIVVTADAFSDPLDVFDIGMPNTSYSVSDVTASIYGVPLLDISNSPYVKPGVAIELDQMAIQPGQTATLHVEALVEDLFYEDTEDDEYASVEFAPNWFDSQFVHGPSRIEVNFHLPMGVTDEEPRYHDEEFTFSRFQDDRVVYTWINENGRGDTQYVYGASFPLQYLAEGVVQKEPVFNFDPSAICGAINCSSPILWFVVAIGGWVLFSIIGRQRSKQRRMKYLPPAVSVEGSGVKRGLTAVEAAILLEAPLNKVMTMILFGLVKKGIITVESEKPLTVTVTDPLPEDVKLWYYERRFLKAVQEDGKLEKAALRGLVIDLIGDVNKKLAGFSRRETKAYYKDVAARAWKQVEDADTPEVLGKAYGDGLEWTMLDDDWDDRTRDVFQGRPVVMPHWWWYYRPWTSTAGSTGTGGAARPSPSMPSPSGGGSTPVTLPTLPGADFANSVVGGVENAASSVVGSVENFTSGITQKTNPPPKSSSSSSKSSGGGYSCACACACAGCACACAGGGR